MTPWSDEDDKTLIKFVRIHEALYNIKSKDYRKTQQKQKLWCEIGTILNKSDSDCSKRWSYVRDYYVRRKGKPGTSSSREAAKSRSELLSFLDSLPMSHRGSLTIVGEDIGDRSEIIENVSSLNSEDEGTPTHIQQRESMTYENNKVNHYKQDSNNGDYNINNDIVSKDNCSAKSNKKRKNISHGQERPTLPCTQNELDETDLFFSSMAKIVKMLPRYEQAQLRMQIGSLVGHAELRHISNDLPKSSDLYLRPSTSEYSENSVHSPSSNDFSEIVVPSPPDSRSIAVNDQGQLLFHSTFKQ